MSLVLDANTIYCTLGSLSILLARLLLADFKKSGKTDKNAATSADGVEAAAKPKAKPKAKGKSKSQKEAQA